MIAIHGGMSAREVCFMLADRNHQDLGPNWTIVEKLTDLHLGKGTPSQILAFASRSLGCAHLCLHSSCHSNLLIHTHTLTHTTGLVWDWVQEGTRHSHLSTIIPLQNALLKLVHEKTWMLSEYKQESNCR